MFITVWTKTVTVTPFDQKEANLQIKGYRSYKQRYLSISQAEEIPKIHYQTKTIKTTGFMEGYPEVY